MSDRIPLKYRRLPDGEFLEGYQAGWDGPFLEFDPKDPDGSLRAGDLLEVECGSSLYLGQLARRRGPSALVLVEHSIDLSKLPALEKAWG